MSVVHVQDQDQAAAQAQTQNGELPEIAPIDPADWRERLKQIEEKMREMSQHTNPQEMVRAYGRRAQQFARVNRRISLSRRGLSYPQYRITRSTTWTEEVNPWQEKDKLPLFEGGLLAKLIYGDLTEVIDDLDLASDEPAFEYLQGQRSLLAIPMYDQGESLNMVVLMQDEPNGFVKAEIPDYVWRSNLFGRAAGALVLREELHQAYKTLDREMKLIGEIQRSLLPVAIPKTPTLDLAAHYQPAHRAGGDYYDFFPLPDGQLGIFIGDVSGHGSPAAVLMAVTHCIAHTHPGPPVSPGAVLNYLNRHLTERYTNRNDTFVTAFYGIYNPAKRTLTYACAGHNPPRVKRCQDGSLLSLDQVGGLPLGILDGIEYQETEQQLQTGDQIIFYTDGITEAHNPAGSLFGTQRLDDVLEDCALQAQALLDSVLNAVEQFAAGRPADDDRTIIVARVS